MVEVTPTRNDEYPLTDDEANVEIQGDPQDTEAEIREQEVQADGHGQRLDRWLVGLAPEFSRNHLQSLVERGCVSIDGQLVSKDSRKLLAGQRVRIELQPTEESRAFRAESLELEVIHEDEHLLVLNKAPGMVVHPAAGNWSGTVMNGLLGRYATAATLPRAGIVHRLDKDTSGVMIVGKSLEAVTSLVRMIGAREVHREYLALTFGRVPEEMVVDAPLKRDLVSRVKMAVLATGKPSRTDVYLLDQTDIASLSEREGGTRSVSAVQCVLHSGRTHQIRVHLSYRGYPLVADGLYGGVQALGLTRQALHAARISFDHPITGEAMSFDAPLPQDLAAAWEKLGFSIGVLPHRET